MAEVNRKTHVSPPLMHAFRAAHEAKDAATKIDVRTDGGERVIAGRRLRPRQAITEQMLRREVARDLDALLNTVAMELTVDMTDTPYVRKSILNFGLPDIASLTIDAIEIKRIPSDIRAAVINFEPRLAAASLEIERDLTRGSGRAQGPISGPRGFDVLSHSGSGRIRGRRHRKRKNCR